MPAIAASIDALTEIVLRAGAAIRAIERPTQRTKTDGSPVTDADEAAQSIILAGLAEILPGILVISEEKTAASLPDPQATFILVDPLDGTREYLAGRDEYTVNVAVVTGGVPVVGLVCAPAQGCVWRGVVGQGAQRLLPGAAPEQIRTRRRPAGGVVAAVSRSHPDRETETYLATLPVARRVVCGSSLKLCRIAEGEADVYPRLAPISEWDIAAGHAVVVAAGGAVTAPDGRPLIYGREPGFRVPGFIAWGDLSTRSDAPLPKK